MIYAYWIIWRITLVLPESPFVLKTLGSFIFLLCIQLLLWFTLAIFISLVIVSWDFVCVYLNPGKFTEPMESASSHVGWVYVQFKKQKLNQQS